MWSLASCSNKDQNRRKRKKIETERAHAAFKLLGKKKMKYVQCMPHLPFYNNMVSIWRQLTTKHPDVSSGLSSTQCWIYASNSNYYYFLAFYKKDYIKHVYIDICNYFFIVRIKCLKCRSVLDFIRCFCIPTWIQFKTSLYTKQLYQPTYAKKKTQTNISVY